MKRVRNFSMFAMALAIAVVALIVGEWRAEAAGAVPFTATFSGVSTATEIDSDGLDYRATKSASTGHGTFGEFTIQTIREKGASPGSNTPRCPGQLDFPYLPDAGAAVLRVQNGDLLYTRGVSGSYLCYEQGTGKFTFTTYGAVIGGTGRFEGATGELVSEGTGRVLLSEGPGGRAVLSALTGKINGLIVLQ